MLYHLCDSATFDKSLSFETAAYFAKSNPVPITTTFDDVIGKQSPPSEGEEVLPSRL